MNITSDECKDLYVHDKKDVPTHDVLKSRYDIWDGSMPDYQIKKGNKIILNYSGKEAQFVTPATKVLSAAVNNHGIERNGKAQHVMKISTKPLESWYIGYKSLPYAKWPDNYFNNLENVVIHCLRIAFDDPDMFEKATEHAWDCVNMEGDDPDAMAFNIFIHNARLPFDNDSWTLKKNMKKGKGQDVFIPIVDVTSMEHTGNFEIEKGAIVSTAIRLWPYYMSDTIYGVSASFGDAGIKVYHKGGIVLPRRHWKQHHNHLVVSNRFDLYDIRGSKFRIKTPIVTIIEQNETQAVLSIKKEGKEDWLKAIKELEHKLKSHMVVKSIATPVREFRDKFTIRINAPKGTFLMNERGILVLKNILYKTKYGTGGIVWSLDKKTKI